MYCLAKPHGPKQGMDPQSAPFKPHPRSISESDLAPPHPITITFLLLPSPVMSYPSRLQVLHHHHQ